MILFDIPHLSVAMDAYGVYRTITSRSTNAQRRTIRSTNSQRSTRPECGDRSCSSKPRFNWWSCHNLVYIKSNGGYFDHQGFFRCSDCYTTNKDDLRTRFEAQQAAEEKKDDSPPESGAQQGGAQQGGAQQGGARQGGAQQGGAQQGGAQQGGAQQGGAQQGGAQQGGIQGRVHNLCMSIGVEPNGSLINIVAVLETSLIGDVQVGTLMVRVATLEALVG